jgi:hypothetical protein
LISGSGYGERKLILWDALMPHMAQPQQYPHMIFWTPAGLVSKILIRNTEPSRDFWLAQSQVDLLDDNAEIETWPGELVLDEEIDTDSDNDVDGDGDDESSTNTDIDRKIIMEKQQRERAAKKRRKVDRFFGINDVKDFSGASLGVVSTSPEGINMEAFEYVPGGHLTISLQVCSLIFSLLVCSVILFSLTTILLQDTPLTF